MELWTEIMPTGAYWNPTRVVSDNRIPAFGSDASVFVLAAPADGPARIEVRLLFRRAFIELMDQKGWDFSYNYGAEHIGRTVTGITTIHPKGAIP
jgi:hypothetical protein